MYLPIEYATSDPPFGLLSFPTAAPKCACRGPCRSRLSSVDDTLATVTILSVHVQDGLRPPVVRFNLSLAYRPGLGGVSRPSMDFSSIISTMAVKPADLTAHLFPHRSDLPRLIGAGCCQGLGDDLHHCGLRRPGAICHMQFTPAMLLNPIVLTDLLLAFSIQFQSQLAHFVSRLYRHSYF